MRLLALTTARNIKIISFCCWERTCTCRTTGRSSGRSIARGWSWATHRCSRRQSRREMGWYLRGRARWMQSWISTKYALNNFKWCKRCYYNLSLSNGIFHLFSLSLIVFHQHHSRTKQQRELILLSFFKFCNN